MNVNWENSVHQRPALHDFCSGKR